MTLTTALLLLALLAATGLALAMAVRPVASVLGPESRRHPSSTTDPDALARAMERKPYPPAFTRAVYRLGLCGALALGPLGCGGAGARVAAPAYSATVRVAKKVCEYVEDLPDDLPGSATVSLPPIEGGDDGQ